MTQHTDLIERLRRVGYGVVNEAARALEAQAREIERLRKDAALVAARERERVAREFDRRAVLSYGGPAVGWYEPNEPAEIVRALNTEGGGNDRP